MHRYLILLISYFFDSLWNFEERIEVLISRSMNFGKKNSFFLGLFIFIYLFWDAFLRSRFWKDFLISSMLVYLNLEVWDLFLFSVLTNLILDGLDSFRLSLKQNHLLVISCRKCYWNTCEIFPENFCNFNFLWSNFLVLY